MHTFTEVVGYEIDVSCVAESADRLTIVLSHSSRTKALQRVAFQGSVIHIVDKTSNYFLYNFPKLIESIKSYISVLSCKQVVIIGSSKGGFGAINIGGRIARHLECAVNVIAFSPQVRLWPANPNLHYPSYQKMLTASSSNEKFQSILERYGDSGEAIRRSNANFSVVYGVRNKVDSAEAALLSSYRNVKLVGLDLATHLTIFPYLVNLNDAENIKLVLNKYFDKNQDDIDASEVKKVSPVDSIVLELQKLRFGKYSLEDLMRVEVAGEVGLNPPPAASIEVSRVKANYANDPNNKNKSRNSIRTLKGPSRDR